ncbi:PREDICTED: uncharacterized protein LOC109583822 [Amphimedon queenslandica]|uniref:NIDO domain-containing protein n=1 Tax=Amphimedon queenslandica TaxID=400682 RepID=A0A1X7UEP6_AMPQE|nr:PREDICTED: uncharacterized protein LOC109583822 [Amphimedon queenslandica]XP_019854861.1 PREDICTED: uncharacterized protein LOC109583822 [Amphimedon queenslandica]XP_019854862.1 PREDICTED: uncharacterized protein LOC109583822 [Amphimedon queenslandica]|eukprot:XP_019854860.1 PREDICTED: uncharacterized protein LOC109583822 [Amphimedon queenslandica]
MRTGANYLPEAPLEPPIDNLVRFGPTGLMATRYRVTYIGPLEIRNDGSDSINLNLLVALSDFSNNKVYGRATDDSILIKRAMDQINEAFPNTFCSTSPPTQLIIATWIDYIKTSSNQGSNFQAIVVTNGSITFGIALYVEVSITTATTGIDSIVNGTYGDADPSFFPFGTDIMDAPSMMLNSNIPGTYIFSLNDKPPDPCTEPSQPDCSVVYKAKLLKMACETLKINDENLPAPCHN